MRGYSTAFNEVNAWHYAMLNDRARNRSYRRALEAAVVANESVVLELGSGTAAVLAMVAARLGARRVFTVEQNPVAAALARETIARNGLSHRVTALECSSFDLTVVVLGEEEEEGAAAAAAAADGTPRCALPEKATVLVHELLSTFVTTEGLLSAVADARSRLLATSAVVIPARVSILGRVVQSQELLDWTFASTITIGGSGSDDQDDGDQDESYAIIGGSRDKEAQQQGESKRPLFVFDVGAAVQLRGEAPLSRAVQLDAVRDARYLSPTTRLLTFDLTGTAAADDDQDDDQDDDDDDDDQDDELIRSSHAPRSSTSRTIHVNASESGVAGFLCWWFEAELLPRRRRPRRRWGSGRARSNRGSSSRNSSSRNSSRDIMRMRRSRRRSRRGRRRRIIPGAGSHSRSGGLVIGSGPMSGGGRDGEVAADPRSQLARRHHWGQACTASTSSSSSSSSAGAHHNGANLELAANHGGANRGSLKQAEASWRVAAGGSMEITASVDTTERYPVPQFTLAVL